MFLFLLLFLFYFFLFLYDNFKNMYLCTFNDDNNILLQRGKQTQNLVTPEKNELEIKGKKHENLR